ncbi:MAG TPA: hypothetical protein PK876_03770 [Elusimicrobiota bacterium]|nr:hypothetical protein [Elusimicrobiota bacterium]
MKSASRRSRFTSFPLLALFVFTFSPAFSQGPKPLALTKGYFRIQYRLTVENDNVVRAKDVTVRLTNELKIPKKASAKVREHEKIHVRINRWGAHWLESEMAKFEWTGKKKGRDKMRLKEAERRFRDAFNRNLQVIQRMHDDWDKTHRIGR